jgi:hypothetical protein
VTSRQRRSDEVTERLIASGTPAGLVTGVAAGVAAIGLGAYLAAKGGALALGFALVLLVAAVNCVYSALAAWRARRAGKPLPVSQGMAGEQRVWEGLERGEPWAVALTAAFGAVLVVIGVAGDGVVERLVIGGFGAAFVVYALHRVRHPKRG